LTETNATAFDAYTLDVNAYKFIDGSIDIVGHDVLLPILEDAKKKGAAAVVVH
jgi:hypothetical protein